VPDTVTNGSADAAFAADEITVEICAVTSQQTTRQRMVLPAKSRLLDIRRTSGLCDELARAWDCAAGFAVFGENRSLQSPLEDGDRVEILRPLQADPKEARRQRARLAKGKA
jgi:uncharacterized protein